ncbi:MgtC/SapB family protein [Nitrosophilus alvini]|uniref:MgtC/SapB family protein n=1 Tax=Nitrosophilus alvini TaxID=2714855 RepID=UPI0019097167|nr:MgtC/SapB family protein [Nitrosophilus alvini]
MELEFAKGLSISVLLGFMIGLQREVQVYHEKSQEFAGARTFAIIALIGYLSAYLTQYSQWLMPLLLFGFVIFLALGYIKNIKITKDIGTTTEFAAVATFLIAALIYFKNYEMGVFAGILLLFLLELKARVRVVKGRISRKDIDAAVLFFIMTFVVLPVLPNRPVDPFGVINLYKIWLMVVLIVGISFAGYISVKSIGLQKGLLVTGFFGGIVSSTAVAITLSKKAVADENILKYLTVAIGLASSTMFFRVVIEVLFVNEALLKHVLMPFIGATIAGYIYLFVVYKKSSSVVTVPADFGFKNPLELKEAVKVGVLFGIVFGAIHVVYEKFGETGIYALSVISGLTDVDAITLSLASMSRSENLTEYAASLGIILASVSNSLTKLFIVYFLGGRKLGLYMAGFYILSLAVLVLLLFLNNFF